MNRHRLYRPSKKIQGRGFLGRKLLNVVKKEVEQEAQQAVNSKLESILSKSIKRGTGLKVVNEAKLEAILGKNMKRK